MIQSHRPNSLRLQGFDYSQSTSYFITICTHNREYILGEIENSLMTASFAGKIVWECWLDLPSHYRNTILDEFIIMPNHFHGIIILTDNNPNPVGAGFKPAPSLAQDNNTIVNHSLSEIIRGFKTFSSKRINEQRRTRGIHVWQRGFHDRIIHNENELYAIRNYIKENPANWPLDKEYIADFTGS